MLRGQGVRPTFGKYSLMVDGPALSPSLNSDILAKTLFLDAQKDYGIKNRFPNSVSSRFRDRTN